MTMPEVVDFITVRQGDRAPVQTGTTVTSVRRTDDGYRVTTDQGEWECDTVVLATGAFNMPQVPALADAVPSSVAMLTPMDYRNPAELADGGVLVVGASATGVQIAHEIQRSGRPVTLAVGEHVRGPRLYRGRDIHWWMEVAGVLDERYDEVDDIVRARRVPSMQLAGSPERATFDLNALTGIGVRSSADSPASATVARSSRGRCGTSASSPTSSSAGCSTRSTSGRRSTASTTRCRRRIGSRRRSCQPPSLGLDLARGEIETIVWATGFRPDYSWLDVDVLDGKGMIRHDGGVVDAPGMYVIGARSCVGASRASSTVARRRRGPHRRARSVPGSSSLGRVRRPVPSDVALVRVHRPVEDLVDFPVQGQGRWPGRGSGLHGRHTDVDPDGSGERSVTAASLSPRR